MTGAVGQRGQKVIGIGKPPGWNHIQSLKEVVRHCFYSLGLSRAVHRARGLTGVAANHLSQQTLERRFQAIYDNRVWVHRDDQEAVSGLGSELRATNQIREELPKLLEVLGCRKLVDVGCGDWTWMRHVSLACEYLGLDVVPSVIAANLQFERSGVSFAVHDAVRDSLPSSDVVLCREVLFHLSFEDGIKLLANMKQASEWVLLTSDSSIWFNSNITSGDFRLLNLQQPPYRLPPPAKFIADEAVSRGRVIGAWRASQL